MSVTTTEPPVAIDLAPIAKVLNLSPERVAGVVKLLDEGNTIPFITRYRKDQTGGLDEAPVRAIHDLVSKSRQLAERKITILRSIESQGKLTPDLARAVEQADTARRLEDLYLPYKPKKQTLATTARSRGLEPLALEILNADPLAADLDLRLRDFVNTDKQVPTSADALLGAGHILAEMFSERADFRGRIRAILLRQGKLVTTAVEPEQKPGGDTESREGREGKRTDESKGSKADKAEKAQHAEKPAEDQPLFAGLVDDEPSIEPAAAETAAAVEISPPVESATEVEAAAAAPVEAVESADTGAVPSADGALSPGAETSEAASVTAPSAASTAKPPREKKKKRPLTKAERRNAELQRAFRDYFQYSEAVSKVPPHRVLAINRGEKAKVLRVRIEADVPSLERVVDEMLVPNGHPHADFLRGCGCDALQRLVLPSLERELRREMTDESETHAVDVFAKNLRNLLLQPPVRDRRLLAIDPGFKNGCKWVALDEFGNMLEHGVVFVVGNAQRRTESKAKLVDVIRNHNLSVIVIGNGTGCRETETMVADMITGDLAGSGVSYVIVSEAGASVYSASPLAREEFPECDAIVRGAVSIGRRLQDPLSELVKIEPNSLGVGLYQHDVKGKHLRESLDAVVESCVNFVGVDLNTASPSLLRYVSGLNQLTAQRIYDHRKEHGPFSTREQLKEVSGIGESAFVQSAGFLKINGGANALDSTWIHPESYEVAERLLESLHAAPADLADKEKVAKIAERSRGIDQQRTALAMRVGTLTLHDILAQLTRPVRDPRDALPPPIFKQGILKIDDLQSGMELRGTVLNVVDFGAFVDIGLKDSGLVHISHMAGKYVKDPHEVVSVGDIVKVWVLQVDKGRRRVSLTMIPPGSKKEELSPRDASQGAAGAGRGAGRTGGGADSGRAPDARGPAGGRQGGPGRGRSDGGKPDGGRRFGGGAGDRGRQGSGRPGGGSSGQSGGGRRFDRRGDRKSHEAEADSTPALPPAPPPKPVPPPKLTKAKLQGRAYLQSFGELSQFLTQPMPAAAPPAATPTPPSVDTPAAAEDRPSTKPVPPVESVAASESGPAS